MPGARSAGGSNSSIRYRCGRTLSVPAEQARQAISAGRRPLAYWTYDKGSLLQSIVVVDLLTGRRELSITPPEMHWPVGPRWSPDGTKLAAEIQLNEAAAENEFKLVASWIAVADLTPESPDFRPIIRKDIWAKYPDWSPDGTTISFGAGNPDPFSHSGDQPENLFTVPADGGAIRQLTHQRLTDPWIGTPSWEPGGFLFSLIGYGSDYRLGTALVDGTDVAEMSDENGARVPGAHPRLAPPSRP